jgi:hypothetical protein
MHKMYANELKWVHGPMSSTFSSVELSWWFPILFHSSSHVWYMNEIETI